MSTYLHRLQSLSWLCPEPAVERQLAEIKQTSAGLEQGKLPRQAIPSLGLLPDQTANLAQKYGRRPVAALNNLLNNFRSYLSRAFGLWSLPNLQTAQTLKKAFAVSQVLEVMAGNGWWSKALQEAGCQTITTDSLQWAAGSATGAKQAVPVIACPAAEALTRWGQEADIILCAWAPNFTQADWQLVKIYRQTGLTAKLLFIGEQDGATDSPQFWQGANLVSSPALQAVNQTFVSFDFIAEKFFLVQ